MQHPTEATTAIVLLDLAVVIGVGSVFASAAQRWGQPAVVGEIIAGILLGPTLVGALPGHLTATLFPPDERAFLAVFANIGLCLFMFGVGFEVDIGHLRRSGHTAAAVSLASVALPFVLGIGTALLIYPHHRTAGGHHVAVLPFALFLGVAMSITAFPVLARILAGLRLHATRLGSFVMGCAAAADVVAWGLLAVVVALVAGSGRLHLVAVLAGVAGLLLALVFVVRPLVGWLVRGPVRDSGTGPLLILVVGLLASAAATTTLGFHPIFGAFAFGAVMPREAIQEVAPDATVLIEDTSRLLVPVFFVTTGLVVNLSALGRRGDLEAVLVLAAACVGKFAGAAGAARLCGLDGRRAAAVGVLMNSRGLTELVVIQVGVSLGVVDRALASMMVLMAVVTTVSATPLFRRLYNGRLEREDRWSARPVRPGPALAARPPSAR
ncbi:MAG: cation:proton antiporter [Mycobacteriales bacterium]